jgi:hypothetical protein
VNPKLGGAHHSQPTAGPDPAESTKRMFNTNAPVVDENCAFCGIEHPAGEPHCPNCGYPASVLFHAGPNPEECPYWLFGRWVMRPDFTAADQAELERRGVLS